MRRTKTFAIVALAAFAIAAVAASSASAKAPTLQLDVFNEATKKAEALPTGGSFELVGTQEELNASPFVCNIGETGLVGTVKTNDAKTDSVEVKLARNAYHENEPKYSKPCLRHGPLKSASAYWRGPSPMGTLTLTTKGKAEYKSASETKLAFVEEGGGTGFCEYGFKTLKGTVETNRPEFLFIEALIGKAKLKASSFPAKGNPCPKTIEIETEFRPRGGALPEYAPGFKNGEEELGSELVG